MKKKNQKKKNQKKKKITEKNIKMMKSTIEILNRTPLERRPFESTLMEIEFRA